MRKFFDEVARVTGIPLVKSKRAIFLLGAVKIGEEARSRKSDPLAKLAALLVRNGRLSVLYRYFDIWFRNITSPVITTVNIVLLWASQTAQYGERRSRRTAKTAAAVLDTLFLRPLSVIGKFVSWLLVAT